MSVPASQNSAQLTGERNPKGGNSTATLWESFDPLAGKKLEIVGPHGEIINPKWFPQVDDERLIHAYKIMLLARTSDLRAVSLQRQGRLYTLPPNIGQEACAVGSAMAIERTDWLVQAYRELGAQLMHGVPLDRWYLLCAGSEAGNVFPDGMRVLPQSVPIASQCLHAAGIAHAIKYKGGSEVAIVYFGDGATSEGDFHEAMNWAAVFSCPVIFFCNNNQYAISYPRTSQTKSKTIAQKAIAYGMPGIQVDGNDLFAVYRATSDAVAWARAGNGPVLIEAETYRMGAHTTSDDPTKYRDKTEEEVWKPRDPIARVKQYLQSKKLWNDKQEAAWRTECEQQIEAAVRVVEHHQASSPEEIMTHVYKDLCPELREQLADLKQFLAWKEGK
ncbi:pyruvate dehydrogenase (acetyl-transferring) E1 component subunit alpha [candidate division KSB1 bacterium]|nr:pyruvate dehydrogenase (acetyl-transferring) E1 component subunit alpha [candidate division KSB1 bacterium]